MRMLHLDEACCEGQHRTENHNQAPRVRLYQKSDWPHLITIYDAARRDELLRCGLQQGFVGLTDSYESEKLFAGEVWVIVEKDQPVGFAAVAEQELTWLYIHPQHYRKGFARLLLLQILNHTKRPLRVCVLAGNHPAIALYESFCFQFRQEVKGMIWSTPPVPAIGLVYELR